MIGLNFCLLLFLIFEKYFHNLRTLFFLVLNFLVSLTWWGILNGLVSAILSDMRLLTYFKSGGLLALVLICGSERWSFWKRWKGARESRKLITVDNKNNTTRAGWQRFIIRLSFWCRRVLLYTFSGWVMRGDGYQIHCNNLIII